MALLEDIEDAFLSALEEGATPPPDFEVRLEDDVFLALARQGTTVIKIAGYTLRLVSEKAEEGPTPDVEPRPERAQTLAELAKVYGRKNATYPYLGVQEAIARIDANRKGRK
jgi:IS5 family transposase